MMKRSLPDPVPSLARRQLLPTEERILFKWLAYNEFARSQLSLPGQFTRLRFVLVIPLQANKLPDHE